MMYFNNHSSGTVDSQEGREKMARAKLNFDNPLLNNEPTVKKVGRPRKEGILRNENGGNSSQEGLPEEVRRFSLICKTSNVEDLKDYAFTKRISIKQAFDDIMEDFFRKYRKNPNNEPLLDRKTGKPK